MAWAREGSFVTIGDVNQSRVKKMMACRHIPTMTKSHHGGEMSVMIKVGMCQCQIPTIHDKLQLQQLALVSYSTRP